MSAHFVRFTVADGGTRPVVINATRIEAYGPWQGKTFLQVGGEEYHVAESFETVDEIISCAMKSGGAA